MSQFTALVNVVLFTVHEYMQHATIVHGTYQEISAIYVRLKEITGSRELQHDTP